MTLDFLIVVYLTISISKYRYDPRQFDTYHHIDPLVFVCAHQVNIPVSPLLSESCRKVKASIEA